MKTPKYMYQENLSNAAIREIFDFHWEYIPLLKKPCKVKVADLQRELLSFHTRNGGKNKIGARAITRMLTEYSRKNPQKISSTSEKGYWYINLGNQKSKTTILKSAKPSPRKKDLLTIQPRKIFGKGDYFVYVFYDNKEICKIGKTLNIQQRYQTLSTSWHEPWSHPYQIRLKNSDDMKEYEKAIHAILKVNGFYIDNKNKKGGNELFKINVKRLLPILLGLNKILNIK